jgi:hypothetical protein
VKQLRNLSPRPELVVDNHARRVGDASTRVGLGGPFGRERIVTALPLNKAGGARLIVAPVILHDAGLGFLGDADGNVIGEPPVWVHRMATARWTADTRRLAV